MTNEIKEILDYLGNDNIEKPFGMATIDKHKLLDYITNLQEENERLKELDENYPIEEQLEEALKYENIYKSKIDKAIEYCNNIMFETKREEKIQDDLLNILQGEDK